MSWTNMAGLLVFGDRSVGAPAAVELDEVVGHLGFEVIGLDPSGAGDGDPELGQVLGAVGAVREVGLEASAVAGCERAVEVVGQELDRLPADQGTPSPEHVSSPPSRGRGCHAAAPGPGATARAGCRR